MSNEISMKAKLTPVAEFPSQYFLENLAIRKDNSILVTVFNHRELWLVPSPNAAIPVKPVKLYTFALMPTGIVETEPDVFYISTNKGYNENESFLERLDLRGWTPEASVEPKRVLRFPKNVRALNGSCLIAPNVLLLADCFAGLIWRVDLPGDGGNPVARVWLEHESMGYYPGQLKPEQPGINGIRHAANLGFVYYTATAKKLFMRVPVNPVTMEAAGEPEHVSAGRMADDFLIDENAGVAYLATHRENTIDCVSLDPAKNSERFIVAGEPFTEELIGPTSGVWSRVTGEYGRVAYFMVDGGTASPPSDGIQRPAKVLRVDFAEAPVVLRLKATSESLLQRTRKRNGAREN